VEFATNILGKRYTIEIGMDRDKRLDHNDMNGVEWHGDEGVVGRWVIGFVWGQKLVKSLKSVVGTTSQNK